MKYDYNNLPNFENMKKDEAIEFLYQIKKDYVYNVGQREFDCLVDILESDTITVSQLKEYL